MAFTSSFRCACVPFIVIIEYTRTRRLINFWSNSVQILIFVDGNVMIDLIFILTFFYISFFCPDFGSSFLLFKGTVPQLLFLNREEKDS